MSIKNPLRRIYLNPRLLSLMLVGLLLTRGMTVLGQDSPSPGAATSEFLLRDDPRPVLFYGDDATAQRMYTTLIETYTLSRFPSWKPTFRNTAWEGEKLMALSPRGNSGDQENRRSRDHELRRDIENFHPQIAVVNYGVNDAREGEAYEGTFKGREFILFRDLPRIGVYRAALISPNPEEGYEAGAPAGSRYNLMLQKYAQVMKEELPVAWKNGVDFMQAHPKGPEVPLMQNGVFIDVLNPMIGFIEAGRKAGVLSPDNSSSDKTVRLTSDGIHLNWSGHLIMAALILEGLHAPDLVSSATLDAADRSTTSAQGCAIIWQDAPAGVIQFERKDDALPWPTPPDVDLALKIPGFNPATTLNRYELKVTGLKEVSYKLSIDDQEIGVYSQADLATGINLGFARRGPIYDQGQKLLRAVLEKNDIFFNRWRKVQVGTAPPALVSSGMDKVKAGEAFAEEMKAEKAHLEEVKPELARLDKIITEKEQEIDTLRRPAIHIFKLQPVR